MEKKNEKPKKNTYICSRTKMSEKPNKNIYLLLRFWWRWLFTFNMAGTQKRRAWALIPIVVEKGCVRVLCHNQTW